MMATKLFRCNQCWGQKPREDFGRSLHECTDCLDRRRGGYTRVGRDPALDTVGPLRVLWVPRSQVKKLGAIPTSTTSGYTCPDACGLKGNGCYAEFGFTGAHWKRLGRVVGTGIAWTTFLAAVEDLPEGRLWRHNLAGDLPGIGDVLDVDLFGTLVRASDGRRGFTFTHKPLRRAEERRAIEHANASCGFTVNLSADGLAHADELADLGIAPVATVVAFDAPARLRTPAGRRVFVCPAQRAKGATCASCRWCAMPGRDWIVGFRAHGQMKKRVTLEVLR